MVSTKGRAEQMLSHSVLSDPSLLSLNVASLSTQRKFPDINLPLKKERKPGKEGESVLCQTGLFLYIYGELAGTIARRVACLPHMKEALEHCWMQPCSAGQPFSLTY